MTNWINLGKGGVLNLTRIVAISRSDSAPIRRLIEAVGRDRTVDLTYGRPKRSAVVLDSGHVVLIHIAPQVLLDRLKELNDAVVESKHELSDCPC